MTQIVTYPDEYKEACFFHWYQYNRNKGKLFVNDGFPDYNGQTPEVHTVIKWKNEYGWVERADALDGEVSIRLEREAIDRKAEATKKLAKTGEELLDHGLRYIKENGFDNSSAAVRAIMGGAELMAKFTGMGDFLIAVTKMSDAQLTKEFHKLLGKNENDDTVIDAEIENGDNSGKEDNTE